MAAGGINKDCIFLFVKSPGQTTVKSRLAKAVGEQKARELYRHFVLDMLDTLWDVAAVAQHDLLVYFYPPEAGQEIRDWLGSSYTCIPQQGNDLGERMQNAFLTGFAAGYRRAILLGSDTPNLTSSLIIAALNSLHTHPAVIGPACDGGYYLLGFQSQAFRPAIFFGMPWSTGKVYTRTRKILQRRHTDVFVLPPWRDIDTITDLQDLQEGCRKGSFAHSRTMRYLLEDNVRI